MARSCCYFFLCAEHAHSNRFSLLSEGINFFLKLITLKLSVPFPQIICSRHRLNVNSFCASLCELEMPQEVLTFPGIPVPDFRQVLFQYKLLDWILQLESA